MGWETKRELKNIINSFDFLNLMVMTIYCI